MSFSDGMFTWSPSRSSRGGGESDVEVIKLDSYEQYVQVGINPNKRSWDLRFERGSTEVARIVDFLESKGGLPFLFTDPHSGLPVRVRVDGKYSFSFNGSVRETLSVRFIEAKSPRFR